MEEDVSRIVIGMDPHKRSVTIEVMSADESVLGGGRFDTTVEGYAALLEYVAAWPERVWAKTSMEAMRRLKRRLSDLVYRTILGDYTADTTTSPGGHRGNDSDPSAAGSRPHTGSSDKPLPGPVTTQRRTPWPTASYTEGSHDRKKAA